MLLITGILGFSVFACLVVFADCFDLVFLFDCTFGLGLDFVWFGFDRLCLVSGAVWLLLLHVVYVYFVVLLWYPV